MSQVFRSLSFFIANLPQICPLFTTQSVSFRTKFTARFLSFYHNFLVFLPKSAAIFFFCRKFTTSQPISTASLIQVCFFYFKSVANTPFLPRSMPLFALSLPRVFFLSIVNPSIICLFLLRTLSFLQQVYYKTPPFYHSFPSFCHKSVKNILLSVVNLPQVSHFLPQV